MNNSDMPAMPLDNDSELRFIGGYGKAHAGLTKREHFAGLAMQGMLASQWVADFCKDHGDGNGNMRDDLAKASVSHADALFAELDKERE